MVTMTSIIKKKKPNKQKQKQQQQLHSPTQKSCGGQPNNYFLEANNQ